LLLAGVRAGKNHHSGRGGPFRKQGRGAYEKPWAFLPMTRCWYGWGALRTLPSYLSVASVTAPPPPWPSAPLAPRAGARAKHAAARPLRSSRRASSGHLADVWAETHWLGGTFAKRMYPPRNGSVMGPGSQVSRGVVRPSAHACVLEYVRLAWPLLFFA